MSETSPTEFINCPNCGAQYKVARVEAPPGPTTDREITCLNCGGPLNGREGDFLFKYVLISKLRRGIVAQSSRKVLKVGAQEFHVRSSDSVPEDKSTLRYEFEPTGKPDIAKGKGTPGHARLYINDKLVGQTDFPFTIPLLVSLGSGLSVGRNPGSPVSQLYRPPFAFTGTVFKVTADISGQSLQDAAAERNALAKAAMSQQ